MDSAKQIAENLAKVNSTFGASVNDLVNVTQAIAKLESQYPSLDLYLWTFRPDVYDYIHRNNEGRKKGWIDRIKSVFSSQ